MSFLNQLQPSNFFHYFLVIGFTDVGAYELLGEDLKRFLEDSFYSLLVVTFDSQVFELVKDFEEELDLHVSCYLDEEGDHPADLAASCYLE